MRSRGSPIFYQTLKINKIIYLVVTLVLACSYLMFANSPIARAANTPFTKAFVRYDNLTALTNTTGRVCFQPTTTTAIKYILVTFPTNSGTDYVVNATATNWTFSTTNLDSGQTAVSNLPTNPTVSGKTITVTLSTALTPVVTNLYCFNWVGGTTLTTPSVGTETAAGQITSENASSTVINQTNFSYSAAIISNRQVVVNAVVPPSFSLALSGNTDTFASNLSLGAVNTTPGNTITVTTNAASGYILWVEDTNYKTVTDSGSNPANEHGALKSATANYAISNGTPGSIGSAPHLFTAGTEDYGLQVANTTQGTGYGSTTISSAYIASTNHAGVFNPTFYTPIASDSGTANGNVITVDELATISGNTPAASDYTDTINYTGAGEF